MADWAEGALAEEDLEAAVTAAAGWGAGLEGGALVGAEMVEEGTGAAMSGAGTFDYRGHRTGRGEEAEEGEEEGTADSAAAMGSVAAAAEDTSVDRLRPRTLDLVEEVAVVEATGSAGEAEAAGCSSAFGRRRKGERRTRGAGTMRRRGAAGEAPAASWWAASTRPAAAQEGGAAAREGERAPKAKSQQSSVAGSGRNLVYTDKNVTSARAVSAASCAPCIFQLDHCLIGPGKACSDRAPRKI